MHTNCTLIAKIVNNKKLNTLRILFSFDGHNKITVRNAALATGDICDANDANANVYIERAIVNAKAQLRCTNVHVID